MTPTRKPPAGPPPSAGVLAKYAQASVVQVDVDASDKTLRLSIHDDGIGGANPAHGSGLTAPDTINSAAGGPRQLQQYH